MTTTREQQIKTYQRAFNKFRGTELGKAFLKYKYTLVRAWAMDNAENDRTTIRLAQDIAEAAERELLREIGAPKGMWN